MGIKATDRKLQHLKSVRVKTGVGNPSKNEGIDGEFTLRETKSGLKLFCKYKHKWYVIGEQSLRVGVGSDGDQAGSASQGNTTINSRTGELQMGGVINMSGARTRQGLIGYGGSKSTTYSSPINGTGKFAQGIVFQGLTDNVYVAGVHMHLESSKRLYFNGGTANTYITGGNTSLDVLVGASTKLQLDTSTSPDLMRLTNADLYLTGNAISATGDSDLIFLTQRGGTPAAGQDGDDLGRISFKGYNDAGTPELYEYAFIQAEIEDASDGGEDGKLTIGLGEQSAVGSKLVLTNHELDFMIGTYGPVMRLDAIQARTTFYDVSGANDYFRIEVNNYGQTTLRTHDASGSNFGDLKLDPAGSCWIDTLNEIDLDSNDGTFKMTHGGTEFSPANSSYSGMILGYTAIGIDAATDSYAVTDAFVTSDATHKVTFVAPPSGKVEIEVSFSAIATALRQLFLGLSDNATYAAIDFPNTADVTNQHLVEDCVVGGPYTIRHKWIVEGLTAKTSYTWWLGAKSEQTGRITMYWGGNADGEYAPFIMKATALPASIYDGS